jgi:hypothetical protein
MTSDARYPFVTKAAWHAEQRRLSPKDKVAIVLNLQRQEIELNRARAAVGRPIRPMVVWNVKP